VADVTRYRRFVLELDGVAQGAFRILDGPADAVGIAMDEARRLRPDGRHRRTPARLDDGTANTRLLFDWHARSLGPAPMLRDAVVWERDDEGLVVARHVLVGAWPVKLRLAPLTPMSLHAVDELELVVERWTRTPVRPPG
jgi:hypothetical protein